MGRRRRRRGLNAEDAWDGVAGPWPRNRRNEIRQGSLVTYVRRARARQNFTILDRALVDRVLIDGGRAVGVAYLDGAGRRREARADHVVVSTGAYGSPAILLRSGVGRPDALRALGIEPVVDLPVGERLLEHSAVSVPLQASDAAPARRGWPALAAAARGDGSAEARRTDPCGPSISARQNVTPTVRSSSSMTVGIPHRTPRSSTTASAAWSRAGASTACGTTSSACWPPTQCGSSASWILPPPTIGRRAPTGCCRPAPTLPAAARSAGSSDPQLGVYAVERLTVADASVFPLHVSNNPNLTCHVIGEIAAAEIAGPGRAPIAAVADRA